jgi:hypothetical protein
MGGCAGPLSLEHYVSKAALLLMCGETGIIRVEGAPPNKPVPAENLGVKMLCKAHNSALSKLDVCGTGFFEALREHSNSPQKDAPAVLAAFNGYDLERWLLKILIGLTCGILPATKKKWRPPLWWLRVLYGKKPMPRQMGLFLSSNIGEDLFDDPRLGIHPLYDSSSALPQGIQVKIATLTFCLLLNESGASQQHRYRPSILQFVSLPDRRETLVALGWNHPHPSTTVSIDWTRNPGAIGRTPPR